LFERARGLRLGGISKTPLLPLRGSSVSGMYLSMCLGGISETPLLPLWGESVSGMYVCSEIEPLFTII
jgi:hypothetical protein